MVLLCPKCGKNEVKKRTPLGPRPQCDPCRDAHREDRLNQQRKRRKGGVDAHHDATGIRYDEREPETRQCSYCEKPYVSTRRVFKIPVCEKCTDHHVESRAVLKVERIKAAYARDPQKVLRRRLGIRLAQIGLSLGWYDSQPQQCGICGTKNPGGKGRWHIDHDHKCCEEGCSKCVRGLLCHSCNVGLGNFKDSPTLLTAAIAWLRS